MRVLIRVPIETSGGASDGGGSGACAKAGAPQPSVATTNRTPPLNVAHIRTTVHEFPSWDASLACVYGGMRLTRTPSARTRSPTKTECVAPRRPRWHDRSSSEATGRTRTRCSNVPVATRTVNVSAPLRTSAAPRMKSGLRASPLSVRVSPIGSVTSTWSGFVVVWDGDIEDEPQETVAVRAEIPINRQIHVRVASRSSGRVIADVRRPR